VTAQNEIHVTFDENILEVAETGLTSFFTLKDDKGNTVGLGDSHMVKDEKAVESHLVITSDADLAAGNYTLEVKNVLDKSPLENKVLPTVLNVVVPDVTKPTIVNVINSEATTTATGALYVEFSEEVDAASALNKANYSYIIDNTKAVSLGAGHTVSLLADMKTVKIVTPKLADGQTGITSLTTVEVLDKSSNKLNGKVTLKSDFAALPLAPTVTKAEVTGKLLKCLFLMNSVLKILYVASATALS
jgi:hypothetical protein